MVIVRGEAMDDEKTIVPDDEVESPEEELEADAVTGASPGTAQACSDLGLNSLESNLAKFNIKPPGVA